MNDSIENILLKSSNDHGILRLTLNDQDNKNALSELMMQELLKGKTRLYKTNNVGGVAS